MADLLGKEAAVFALLGNSVEPDGGSHTLCAPGRAAQQ